MYLAGEEFDLKEVGTNTSQFCCAIARAGGLPANTQSMKDMKLLPFTGLNIAMSGIEPSKPSNPPESPLAFLMKWYTDCIVERRRQVVHYITTNGGQYSKDLDGNCTHLISAKMTTERNVSEKVKWAVAELAAAEADRRKGKKVEHTELWIVFEEWIWDCVGYEGRWKEDMYDARKVRRTPRCHAGTSYCW